jgi:TonB-linked SusC/RagA family outer membrane protein
MRLAAPFMFIGMFAMSIQSFSNPTFSIKNDPVKSILLTRSKYQISDTIGKIRDTVLRMGQGKNSIAKDLKLQTNAVSPTKVLTYPAITLQQYLKGQAPGLYVQEPSSEPGSLQNMFIHGTSTPILSAKELFQSQPLVVLDGIQLVGEHPFAFDIQQYKFNRIGPVTNLLGNIDMENIASIEVLSDLAATAVYGPRAINGVIVLTSKTPDKADQIAFNSWVGIGQRPQVTTINGSYENAFRKQFYDRYTASGRFSDDEVYPLYLSDSLSTSYYGKSDWTDLYYRNSISYNANAAISGGVERANFRFSVGNVRNEGIADETLLNRYSSMFNINMTPLEWLTFSAMVNANRLERDRNRSQRDRFSQMSYVPDLSSPLSPNKSMYGKYLTNIDNGFDDNKTNVIEGLASLTVNVGKFSISSRFGYDYNEGYRDIFYSKALMEGNSYASNYYGFNQRLTIDNIAAYNLSLNGLHEFHFGAGQSMNWDSYKYNYAYAYKGANDFIKLNLLEGDKDNENYLQPTNFPRELVYKFIDQTKNNLLSFFGKADYEFNNKYSFSFLLRADASSNAQPSSRWFVSPVVSAGWNIKNDLLSLNGNIDQFKLRASVGRLGRIENFDSYSQGPQYTSDISYTGNVTAPSYTAIATLSRPYNYGWIGYGIPWAYANQLNVGFDLAILKNRLRLSADLYTKTDKNQILGLPSYAEYGYTQSYESGLSVNNKGLDLNLSGDVVLNNTFSWTPLLNLNFNNNSLLALPRGLNELVIGNRFLKVGQSIDQYWLYANDGMYTADDDVPLVNGAPLKFNGITLMAGDPKWKDINGDGAVNTDDKSLKGNMMPKLAGGFRNDFKFKNWTLAVDMYFNLGREIINQEMANHFDFINQESGNTINSVKEITFWEKRGDYSKYPIYNPWSTVIPYRVDQDLFLEDGSFIKLRTVSLGYDLSKWFSKKSVKGGKLYLYGTASNLITITSYSGQDPELVGYSGYNTGYGLPMAKTYTLGIRMGL